MKNFTLFSILALFTEDVQLNEEFLNASEDSVPHMSLSDEEESKPHIAKTPAKTEADSLSEEIVARASVNSTIAIIPAQAFRNLTTRYPKATSHIVQVILTRCQRVLFKQLIITWD